MCRITGLIHKSPVSYEREEVLLSMRDSMTYGGPDDAGSYFDNDIAIGHRRLSIIDLTSLGHQPMFWKDLVVVFNGEIYNYKQIANDLKKLGYSFNSDSDTEVILKAYEHWGYECVHHFRGMFTFAIWNRNTKKLLLCRDRVGVKPLYWYKKDGLFMFSSELKAFQKHPDFDRSINQQAVSLFLQTGYIRSPFSIFEYAHKVMPGSFLEIDENLNIRTWKYWDVREQYLKTTIREGDETTLIKECEKVLTESFKLRMVADVPVGMFLSGGIDSTLVTALLQREYSKPLKTFTIGFENTFFNEAHHAKKVANYLGTNHTELYCNEKHFESIIRDIPYFYDEPFGDSSAIPTFLVSQLAKNDVTVSLSADGGDEIFTGYNRYIFAEQLFRRVQMFPKRLRNFGSSLLENLNQSTINNLITYAPLPDYYKKNIDARIPKLIELLKAESPLDFLYASTIFLTPKGLSKYHNFVAEESIFNRDLVIKDKQKFGAYGVVDIESYLEGDILAKVDRATMQVSLEGREPFLDHKIIEFALSLPDNYKIRNGETKWILRKILYQYVPKELIERPKMGFGIPLDHWLKTILKPQVLEMLNDSAFFEEFRLNKSEIEKLIDSYFNNKSHNPYFIWYLYCLFQWHVKWK